MMKDSNSFLQNECDSNHRFTFILFLWNINNVSNICIFSWDFISKLQNTNILHGRYSKICKINISFSLRLTKQNVNRIVSIPPHKLINWHTLIQQWNICNLYVISTSPNNVYVISRVAVSVKGIQHLSLCFRLPKPPEKSERT